MVATFCRLHSAAVRLLPPHLRSTAHSAWLHPPVVLHLSTFQLATCGARPRPPALSAAPPSASAALLSPFFFSHIFFATCRFRHSTLRPRLRPPRPPLFLRRRHAAEGLRRRAAPPCMHSFSLRLLPHSACLCQLAALLYCCAFHCAPLPARPLRGAPLWPAASEAQKRVRPELAPACKPLQWRFEGGQEGALRAPSPPPLRLRSGRGLSSGTLGPRLLSCSPT